MCVYVNFPIDCMMLFLVFHQRYKNHNIDVDIVSIPVKMASQNVNREEFVEGWTLAQTLGEGAYGE